MIEKKASLVKSQKVISKNEQVEELQSMLEKKDEIVKELDSQVKGTLQDG